MDVKNLWYENLIAPLSQRYFHGKASPEKATLWRSSLGPRSIEGTASRLGRLLPGSSWRSQGILFLTIVPILVLVSKSFGLQVVHGMESRQRVEENRLRLQVIRAPRGIIYDRNGDVLAKNSPGFRVIWDPSVAVGQLGQPYEKTSIETVANGLDWEGLAEALGLSREEILLKIRDQSGSGIPVVLKPLASKDEALAIEGRFSDFPGIETEVSPTRSYPYANLFSHVLGFTGEGNSVDSAGGVFGRGGLEEMFDQLLRGKEGRRLVEVDALGKGEKEVAKKEPEVGLPLQTSLDADLQKVAYEALSWGVSVSGASGGALVAEDPQSGEILSLVSLPDFDPNLFVAGLSQADFQKIVSDYQAPLFNRAISGTYPPGSIFKVVTAVAALENKTVGPETAIDCQGSISVGDFSYGDWKSHGKISLVEALGQSCDVYFYTIGGGYGNQKGVGPQELSKWAGIFGLGERTGIEQPWEAAGLVPDPDWKLREKHEPWYLGNTYHMAIGQGDLRATPLQVSNLISSIANGGRIFRPSLLLGGSRDFVGDRVSSASNLDWVKAGMASVCQSGGTAYPMFDFPVSCGCKTGTAETGSKKTHAWFTVFAPFENPEIVLTVFLENGGEGSRDAAPIARKILDWYFARKQF